MAVGKYVFPTVSGMNSFFAMTVRKDDDGATPLLLGQSVIRNHRLADGGAYAPDGWWAHLVDGVPLPLDDCATVHRFAETWSLARGREPGLSVILPFVEPSLTVDGFIDAVTRDYFIALLSGMLVVEVEGGDVVGRRTLSTETPVEVVRSFPDTDDRRRLEGDIDLIAWAHTKRMPTGVALDPGAAARWSPNMIPAEARGLHISGDPTLERRPVPCTAPR
jgi:hypothetical protein